MKFDAATLTFDLAPIGTDKPGKYTILVTLSDSTEASKSYRFDVEVL
jgi:hypothetical protein